MGELAEIVGGGTPSTSVNSYWDGDIDWYAPAEIGEQIYLESSQRKITEEGLNKSSAKILPIGTVLFTSRAGIGKTAILQKEGCTNQGFQSIVPNKEKLDSYFIFTRSEELKRYGETVGAGSTFVEVSGKQMANMELMMPKTMPEQQQIGEFFTNLDHFITLHQRKYFIIYNKLITWEQRKLGEVFKEYSEKNHMELPALTIIQGGGTVKREESDRNLMYDESNLSNYKMVRKDDFIVHLRSFEGGLEKSLLDGIISPAYHTFHSDVADSRFYYPYFRSHEFIKHKLVPHIYGIRDGRSIDIAGMKTIEIPYTSIEEQRKIGDYLESLDHLITLHRRAL